jgi:hypothetical protein
MVALVTDEVFVQVARAVLFDGRVLTLVDPAPSTIRVTATPAPEVDYICTGTVLDRWADAATASGAGSWEVPGTVALLDPEAQVAGDAVVVVSLPRVTAAGLAYDVQALAGIMPSESGACVLYLDWGGARGVT